MKTEHVSIPCGEIELEGQLYLPDGRQWSPAVVVCHPHPLYGGDMENNVVTAICGTLVENSIAALRFNFRGVGRSGGKFGGGLKEQEDVKAVIDYLSSRQDIALEKIGLVGYSFGGSVAFPVAREDTRVKKLALVSPAINDTSWQELVNYTATKVVIVGDADTVISFARIKKYFTANRDFQIVTGADHFWWGFEGVLSRMIVEFFNKSW